MDKSWDVLRKPAKIPLAEGEWRTEGDGTVIGWEDFSLDGDPYASISVNGEEVGGEDIIISADDLVEIGEFFVELGQQLAREQT